MSAGCPRRRFGDRQGASGGYRYSTRLPSSSRLCPLRRRHGITSQRPAHPQEHYRRGQPTSAALGFRRGVPLSPDSSMRAFISRSSILRTSYSLSHSSSSHAPTRASFHFRSLHASHYAPFAPSPRLAFLNAATASRLCYRQHKTTRRFIQTMKPAIVPTVITVGTLTPVRLNKTWVSTAVAIGFCLSRPSAPQPVYRQSSASQFNRHAGCFRYGLELWSAMPYLPNQ